ncbi:MAG: DUF2304 domain-containing protein [Bacilli bacterium]|nr:DUF2304 domain-containing protein [Bacilli bacterium]
MSKSLVISLVVFSIIWIIIILRLVRNGKLSIKYSMIWLFMSLIIFVVGIFPKLMELISDFFGFLTISNLVIGIILTLLLFITLVLTMIVTNQKSQINNLIQEVSMLKKDK